jgi:hypothetical protein
MSRFGFERVSANLAQDRFAKGCGLTEQHGLKIEVLVIGAAILDPDARRIR